MEASKIEELNLPESTTLNVSNSGYELEAVPLARFLGGQNQSSSEDQRFPLLLVKYNPSCFPKGLILKDKIAVVSDENCVSAGKTGDCGVEIFML